MTKIDRYILFKYLVTFFFSISLFLTITIVFDTAEKIDDFIENQIPLSAIVVDYYLNFLPYFGVQFCPLFTFIAVIYFTSKMAYNSEIVAIIGSGTSFYRLLVPYFLGAIIIGGLDYYAIHWVVPESNKKRFIFENTYINSKFYNTNRNIHFQLDDNTFASMENYSVGDSSAYKFALETFRGTELESKLMARKIKWNSQKEKWDVFDYMIRENNGLEETVRKGKQMDLKIALAPKDFGRKIDILPAMNTDELDEFIAQEIKKGVEEIDFYLIEKYKRTAFPFATLVLTLIGFSLASRKVRGGKGLHIAIGITLSFAYIVFMQFSTTLSTNANLPPMMGVWIPNIIFAILGLYLLKIAPK